jgi:hypothetical protein
LDGVEVGVGGEEVRQAVIQQCGRMDGIAPGNGSSILLDKVESASHVRQRNGQDLTAYLIDRESR